MLRVSEERTIWLSRFVIPHEPALRVWLRRRTSAGIEVDDIVQETYSRLIGLDSVADIRNVRGYIFQVAHSVLVHTVRRSKIVPIEVLSDVDEYEAYVSDPTPEDYLLGRDELSQVYGAIGALPRKMKEVFLLRRVDGLSQREVAQKLGLAESTVEKHMSRGILMVLNLLTHGGNEGARASKAWGKRLSEDSSDRDVRRQRQ
ncbi:RNA polymerase sigma factor [Asticcacaulis sp. BYS171W]|uniref:RNA polymerase sigma factor n=1 Tax=Asticcacaulis aquaticus TaxID=2984212 RepID=A0ABT5HQ02_9CAUL|nr:RNA polymerase sigma factor [Asticcacaulis aquaticus]MDC7682124.1 RNA polymerase sigma factor [Asticcacaulis aquaticus]